MCKPDRFESLVDSIGDLLQDPAFKLSCQSFPTPDDKTAFGQLPGSVIRNGTYQALDAGPFGG